MDLKTARKKTGITQMELSEKSGIHQPHISIIEQGKIFPTTETRKKIEKAIKTKIDWISTRLQKGGRNLNFVPDGQEDGENQVFAAISIYIKTGPVKERPERFQLLRDFVNQYEKALMEGQNK